MVENEQDILARAFSMLTALRENTNKISTMQVQEIFVTEYHNTLDKLESIGKETSDFRIPESEITPRVTTIRTLTFGDEPAGPVYSKEKYVDKLFILTKIDAILGYFELITSKEPRKMGYTK